jgi:hypothetical protein
VPWPAANRDRGQRSVSWSASDAGAVASGGATVLEWRSAAAGVAVVESGHGVLLCS